MTPLQFQSDLVMQSDLLKSGFWMGHLSAAVVNSADWTALQMASSALPRDTYSPEANRYRTLNRFRIQLDDEERGILTEDLTSGGYLQTESYNPELGGINRQYPRGAVLSEKNIAVQSIFERFVPPLSRVLEIPFPFTIGVNVHHVRYAVTPASRARNSPSGYHKDGERFISVHLLQRSGLTGGGNRIADNHHCEIAQFTMQEPGESFLIDDARVWHLVEDMHAAEGFAQGSRDILLVDYIPEV